MNIPCAGGRVGRTLLSDKAVRISAKAGHSLAQAAQRGVSGMRSESKASDKSVRATRACGIITHPRVLPGLETSNHRGQKRFLFSALRTYWARSGTLSGGSALGGRRLLRSIFRVPFFDCAHGG